MSIKINENKSDDLFIDLNINGLRFNNISHTKFSFEQSVALNTFALSNIDPFLCDPTNLDLSSKNDRATEYPAAQDTKYPTAQDNKDNAKNNSNNNGCSDDNKDEQKMAANEYPKTTNTEKLTQQLNKKLLSEIDDILDQEVMNTKQTNDYFGFTDECKTTQVTPRKKSKKKKSKRKKKPTVSRDGGQYEPMQCNRARGNIRISRTLTEKIIPETIKEQMPIANVWCFIDRSTALQFNDRTRTDNNNDNIDEQFQILNYDFHDKQTGEILYCVIDRFDGNITVENGGYKWNMLDKLFTAKEIEQMYKLPMHKLPTSSREKKQLKLQLYDANKIKKELVNVDTLDKLIHKTAWHKMVVFNRKNSTERITLSLSKERFIKRLTEFVDTVCMDEIKLIPILMFDSNNSVHWIEHVWVISIGNETNIAISMKLSEKNNNNKKKNKKNLMDEKEENNMKIMVRITGIHIDKQYLQTQHELISFHDCHCFDDFQTKINDFSIGNPDEKDNKIKNLQLQIERNKYNNELLDIQNMEIMQLRIKELLKENSMLKSKNKQLIKASENGEKYKVNSKLNASAPAFKFMASVTQVQKKEISNMNNNNNNISTEMQNMQFSSMYYHSLR